MQGSLCAIGRGATSQRQPGPMKQAMQIENRTPRALKGVARDDLPDDFDSDPEFHPVALPTLGQVRFQRRLTSKRRGMFQLSRVDICLRSPMRLWNRYLTLKCFSLIWDLNALF